MTCIKWCPLMICPHMRLKITRCLILNKSQPKSLAIYQLCRSMPGTGQGQAGTSRDKQGQSRDIPFLSLLVPTCPCLSLTVNACPCLSLSVPVCPCLSLSVSVCLFICYTFMSTPADEYKSLHQYDLSYIDFPCKSHCSNAGKPCFNFSLVFILLPQ